jgi:hypothetical protein
VNDENQCNSFKFSEGACCPSSAEFTLPPVTEGDFCYICGSVDVEMSNPNGKPYGFGSNDEDDEMTCLELEADLNANRVARSTCASALSFALLGPVFVPSFCGCEGAEPINAPECMVCDEIDRNAIVPDETFTCGEGYDYLKHVRKELCQQEGFSEVIESTCCVGGGSGGGSDGGSDAALTTTDFSILAISSISALMGFVFA